MEAWVNADRYLYFTRLKIARFRDFRLKNLTYFRSSFMIIGMRIGRDAYRAHYPPA